jgi:hypothetical protein
MSYVPNTGLVRIIMHKVDCVIIPYLRVYYQLLVQLGKCILYNGPDWMTACEHTN